MSITVSGSSRPSGGLARGAIGLREVVFQSITHMAPAMAVAFSITFGITFGGGATSLAVVLALLGSLFCAIAIGQLAKHLPSAGSFYTYTSRGIHPSAGFLVAWVYALVEPLVAPILYLQLGYVMAQYVHPELGWSPDLWWIWSLAAAAIVFLLGYLGIQISTRTGTILGIFEVGVFAVLAVWLIVEAGDRNTLEVFTTDFANIPGQEGIGGVFAASVYTILAFIGFEAAAPLAEEAKDPQRTVPRAVVLSCVVVGTYYVLTTYGATVFFGPERMGEFGTGWVALARAVWGVGWILVVLAMINSAIANANASSNAATRTLFAMGRIRLLPAFLAQIHPRFRSPHVAVWIQLIVGVVATLWLGFGWGMATEMDPFTASFVIATSLVVGLVPIYILVNLACILFYARERRDEFSMLKHVLIPVLGIIAFVPGFLAGAGLKVFDFIIPLEWPLTLGSLIVAIWVALGIVYLIVLYATNRQRITDTARVFIEDDSAAEAARGSTVGPS
jgi:amino acid transporter